MEISELSEEGGLRTEDGELRTEDRELGTVGGMI